MRGICTLTHVVKYCDLAATHWTLGLPGVSHESRLKSHLCILNLKITQPHLDLILAVEVWFGAHLVETNLLTCK